MAPDQPTRPAGRSVDHDDLPPKPYELVSFPKKRPVLAKPVGHHRYAKTGYHGTLSLSLKVKTALHASTGITAMGSDMASRVPLIKTMTQGRNQQLVIQGSSLLRAACAPFMRRLPIAP